MQNSNSTNRVGTTHPLPVITSVNLFAVFPARPFSIYLYPHLNLKEMCCFLYKWGKYHCIQYIMIDLLFYNRQAHVICCVVFRHMNVL